MDEFLNYISNNGWGNHQHGIYTRGRSDGSYMRITIDYASHNMKVRVFRRNDVMVFENEFDTDYHLALQYAQMFESYNLDVDG